MAEVVFKFSSEAPYSEDELQGLSEDLIDAAKKFDDEVITSSADISLVDPDEKKKQAADLRAAAMKVLEEGIIEVKVNLLDADGDDIRSVGFTTED